MIWCNLSLRAQNLLHSKKNFRASGLYVALAMWYLQWSVHYSKQLWLSWAETLFRETEILSSIWPNPNHQINQERETRTAWVHICLACFYLEFICIIEVYAHSRDHPGLEEGCQNLFRNSICDEVEVKRVSPDVKRETYTLVKTFVV